MSETKGISICRHAWICLALIFAIVFLDQALKIWIKTHFFLGEDMEILPFFHLHFIQNNGMAFGWELGSKLFLTYFRFIMVGVIGWLLYKYIRYDNKPLGFLLAISAIAAGALGNIFDCVFYGEIFTNPFPPVIAEFTPIGHGYGSWFQGLVVDMLWFPLFSFTWPDWLPVWGGQEFSFFDPVFNIADSAITVGVIILVFFYSKFISLPKKNENE